MPEELHCAPQARGTVRWLPRSSTGGGPDWNEAFPLTGEDPSAWLSRLAALAVEELGLQAGLHMELVGPQEAGSAFCIMHTQRPEEGGACRLDLSGIEHWSRAELAWALFGTPPSRPALVSKPYAPSRFGAVPKDSPVLMRALHWSCAQVERAVRGAMGGWSNVVALSSSGTQHASWWIRPRARRRFDLASKELVQAVLAQRAHARRAALAALSTLGAPVAPRATLLEFPWSLCSCPSSMPMRAAREILGGCVAWLPPEVRGDAIAALLCGAGNFQEAFDKEEWGLNPSAERTTHARRAEAPWMGRKSPCWEGYGLPSSSDTAEENGDGFVNIACYQAYNSKPAKVKVSTSPWLVICGPEWGLSAGGLERLSPAYVQRTRSALGAAFWAASALDDRRADMESMLLWTYGSQAEWAQRVTAMPLVEARAMCACLMGALDYKRSESWPVSKALEGIGGHPGWGREFPTFNEAIRRWGATWVRPGWAQAMEVGALRAALVSKVEHTLEKAPKRTRRL